MKSAAWLTRFLVAICIVPAPIRAEKKPKAPPPVEERFPTSKEFPLTCAAAWPHTLATLIDHDFQVLSSDRDGGLISFKSSSEYNVESLNVGFRSKPSKTELLFRSFTLQHPGILVYAYRIEPSTLLLIPKDQKCHIQFSLHIIGLFDRAASRGLMRLDLTSSGRLESALLLQIENRLPQSPASSAAKPN